MAIDRLFLTVPNFEFAVNYFPQIAARLREFNRINAEEITNEDPRGMFVQLERAFALMAHYNNTLLDMVANNIFLKTATLPESVKQILELIDYRVLPAGPAVVDMLAEVSGRYSTTTRILESYRRFATRRSSDKEEIVFENPSAFDLRSRNDSQGLTYGYGLQFTLSGSGASVSSVYSDILTDSTAPFTSAHLNNYLSVSGSTIGNAVEDLRITELLDEGPVGYYSQVRLAGASFTSESGLNWIIRTVSNNHASNWNVGTPSDPLPSSFVAGDKIFFGHSDLMWDKINLTLNTSVTPGYDAVVEFYDPTDSTTFPTSVTSIAGGLKIDCTSLLGTEDVNGALVEVTYIKTGTKYRGFTEFLVSANVLNTTTFFGQSTPSTNASDYLIDCKWRPISITNDTTKVSNSIWSQNGVQEFDVPQNRTDKWLKYNIYDHLASEDKYAFFLRFRIVNPAGGSGLVPSRLRIDDGKEYALITLLQGQTVEDSPLASSNGQANQEYLVSRKPVILGSFRVFIDEGGGEFEYIVYSSLLNSISTDRHCRVDYISDGSAKLIFGDGVNGKIPPLGTNNIRTIYRIGADVNGNVGVDTLTVNRDGAGTFRNITNPRQGRYWIEPDWSSESALERTKERGIRQIKTMSRAAHSKDVVTLATRFQTQAGTRPVIRAKAYEEGLGPKTIELIVAGGGGAALTSLEIEELEEYFNGGEVYGYPGVILNNTRVYVKNYIPRIIPFTMRVEAYDTVTEDLVKQLLNSVVEPGAIASNGYSFLWRFGQKVALSKIASEVFNLSPSSVFDVDFIVPTADIVLTPRQLPIVDAVNTQVIIVPPSFIE